MLFQKSIIKKKRELTYEYRTKNFFHYAYEKYQIFHNDGSACVRTTNVNICRIWEDRGDGNSI